MFPYRELVKYKDMHKSVPPSMGLYQNCEVTGICQGRGGFEWLQFPDSTCKLLPIVFLRQGPRLELTLIPVFSVKEFKTSFFR